MEVLGICILWKVYLKCPVISVLAFSLNCNVFVV